MIAGTRYENQRRELDKSLKTKQDVLKAKSRQGGWGYCCIIDTDGVSSKVGNNSMACMVHVHATIVWLIVERP